MVPAFLTNIRIDSREKFEFFKVTLADVAGLFDECHVKVRGTYARECVDFARQCLGKAMHDHQALQEADWVAATLQMLGTVKSRSVFIYFEDHRIVTGKERIRATLAAFDESGLDYLCYSFFRASQLEGKNLLPLCPVQREMFTEFNLNRSSNALVGKISPNYYTFSLLSIASVEYFGAILAAANAKHKVYSRLLLALLTRLFRYPGYRKALNLLNSLIKKTGIALVAYEASSPFNLEKLWHETVFADREWRFGIPLYELFANYDDDNGAYGESLIKKGAYPLEPGDFNIAAVEKMGAVTYPVLLAKGQTLDCTYHSHNARIRQAPVVEIRVIDGGVEVQYRGESFALTGGESRMFYSNMAPTVLCTAPAMVEIRVSDETF